MNEDNEILRRYLALLLLDSQRLAAHRANPDTAMIAAQLPEAVRILITDDSLEEILSTLDSDPKPFPPAEPPPAPPGG